MKYVAILIVGATLFVLVSNLVSQEKRLNNFQRKLALEAAKLQGLHRDMGPVKPGDWLSSHNEPGQTFRQYVNGSPVRVSAKRKKLYVLPLGEFDENQQRIVDLSAEFLGLYFACDVKTLATLSLDEAIPETARRVHPSWGVRQIKSLYILNEVLPERLPKDGVALIALTASDLYPDDNWNFVFGQASLQNRVGVWSLFRNGDPSVEFKKCLERTIKTATHETGHMFSIRHCIAYDCNMCGSNSLQESDRRPIYLCPECVSKVWWATKSNPERRYKKLLEFCEQNELNKYANYYRSCLNKLEE